MGAAAGADEGGVAVPPFATAGEYNGIAAEGRRNAASLPFQLHWRALRRAGPVAVFISIARRHLRGETGRNQLRHERG